MLDTFICDENKNVRLIIKNECIKFSIEKNTEGDVFEFCDNEELIVQLKTYNLIAVYFLECNKMTELLADALEKSSNQNYISLVSDKTEDIVNALSPNLRPSGFVIKPPGQMQIEMILNGIYEDYKKKRTGDLYRFKIKSRIYSVDYKNIFYFETSSKKMIIHTSNQEYDYYENFANIESQLPKYFIRVHKSFMINMNNVENIDFKNMEITMMDGSIAYISRTYRKNIDEYLEK